MAWRTILFAGVGAWQGLAVPMNARKNARGFARKVEEGRRRTGEGLANSRRFFPFFPPLFPLFFIKLPVLRIFRRISHSPIQGRIDRKVYELIIQGLDLSSFAQRIKQAPVYLVSRNFPGNIAWRGIFRGRFPVLGTAGNADSNWPSSIDI